MMDVYLIVVTSLIVSCALVTGAPYYISRIVSRLRKKRRRSVCAIKITMESGDVHYATGSKNVKRVWEAAVGVKSVECLNKQQK